VYLFTFKINFISISILKSITLIPISAKLTCSTVSCSSSSWLRLENPTLRLADRWERLLSLNNPGPLFSNATDISKNNWVHFDEIDTIVLG
jgi:hypothetical protein